MSEGGRRPVDDRTAFSLADGAALLGVTAAQLWWDYAALGGALDPLAFAELVAGGHAAGPLEADVAAQTMNEAFLDLGLGSFPVGYERRRAGVVLPRRPGYALTPARLSACSARQAAAMTRAREVTRRSAALIEDSTRLYEQRHA